MPEAIKMTKAEFKTAATRVLTVAKLLAALTPTQKDDQVVAIFDGLVNNQEQFDALCALLGITD